MFKPPSFNEYCGLSYISQPVCCFGLLQTNGSAKLYFRIDVSIVRCPLPFFETFVPNTHHVCLIKVVYIFGVCKTCGHGITSLAALDLNATDIWTVVKNKPVILLCLVVVEKILFCDVQLLLVPCA